MFWTYLTGLIIASGAGGFIYFLWRAWTWPQTREIDEVIHFLYPVDLSLAEALLDPAAEFAISWSLTPEEFREAQRKRLGLYLEVVRRMAHNSMVLLEFGNTEFHSDDPRTVDSALTLQQRALEVRIYSLATMAKIYLWIWCPVAAISKRTNIYRLRKTGDLDGPRMYGELKDAATAAFRRFQPSDLETLARNL